jgi:hypothetical protein
VVHQVIDTIETYRGKNPAVIDLFDGTNAGPHDRISPADVLALNALNAFGPTAPMTPMTKLWRHRAEVEQSVAPITKAEIESLSGTGIEASPA